MREHVASPAQGEADYVAAVDDFLRSQEDLEQVDERRRSQRYSYATQAMVAFCPEGQVPPINWFESIRCCDISRGGFAFLASEPPQQRHLVVILRRQADYLSLFARVVHICNVEVDGTPSILVGCEFIGRVETGLEAVQVDG